MPRISQLTSLTVPDGSDELAIVDVSASVTKKITRTSFLSGSPLPNNTITTASITDTSVTTAKIADNSVTSAKLAVGTPVQLDGVLVTATSTGTNTIPNDTTIPQISEGDQFMTLSFTPKSATNKLLIEAVVFVSHSAAVGVIGAIFQGSTLNALAVGTVRNTVGTEMNMLTVRHIMTTGTTSPITFTVRIGGDSPGTLTFNGSNGGQRFGGTAASTLTITEYKA